MQLCRRDLLNINHVEGKIADEGLDYIDVKGNVKQIMFLYGLPPLSRCSQGISIASPTTKEPVWIAFTTMTIRFQSSTQNELSNVNRNNSVTKEVMGAKPAAPICCPVIILIILFAFVAH